MNFCVFYENNKEIFIGINRIMVYFLMVLLEIPLNLQNTTQTFLWKIDLQEYLLDCIKKYK